MREGSLEAPTRHALDWQNPWFWDEKALEAVRQYKFKPAMENGKPVLVELNVEVNFQIF